MSLIRSLIVKVGADLSGMEKGLAKASKEMKSVGKSFTTTGASLTKGVTVPLIAIGVALGATVKDATNAEKYVAQLDAVLKSTGGAAGMTRKSLLSMAEGFEKSTKFSAEMALEAQSLLLTFTNIGKNVFPAATQAAADMATALGTDMAAQSIALGKALNDPIKGITALTRVGVSFTDAQKEQIKAMQEAGDVAGAQTIILNELNKQFGGSAEAAGKTFGGQLIILKNSLEGVSERIGAALIPLLTKLTPLVVEQLTPAFERFTAGVVSVINKFDEMSPTMKKTTLALVGLAIGAGPVFTVFGRLTLGMSGMVKGLGLASKAISGGGGILTAMSALLGPAGLALLAVGGIAAVSYVVIKHWDDITFAVEAATDSLIGWNKTEMQDKTATVTVNTVWDAVKKVLNPVGTALGFVAAASVAAKAHENYSAAVERGNNARRASIDRTVAAEEAAIERGNTARAKALGFAQKADTAQGESTEKMVDKITDALRRGYATRQKLDNATLDNELKNIEKRRSAQLDSINSAYNQALKSIDEETQKKISGVQEQIDAIDLQRETEAEALRTKKELEIIAALQSQYALEEDADEKAKIQEQIDAEVLARAERLRQIEIDIQRNSLQQQIDDIKANADSKKQMLADELESQTKHFDDIYEAEKASLELRKAALDEFYEYKMDAAQLAAEAESTLANSTSAQVNDLINKNKTKPVAYPGTGVSGSSTSGTKPSNFAGSQAQYDAYKSTEAAKKASNIAWNAKRIASIVSGADIGKNLASFAAGTPYVPRDMIAKIHKGEAIIPASENKGKVISITNYFTSPRALDEYTISQNMTREGQRLALSMGAL